jgi:hypothetical protein
MSTTKSSKTVVKNKALRKEILQSAVASFKIEGIHVSGDKALAIFKKVEFSLEKRPQ